MAADEGGEHLPNCDPVSWRVPCDPLRRVDPTEPHVQLRMAELVDRTGVSLRDLPFASGGRILAARG
jgi:hypothetical protein